VEYKVKDNFFLHKGDQCYPPGAVVELTETEAVQFAAQVEEDKGEESQEKTKKGK
jgi:hypothetical protein